MKKRRTRVRRALSAAILTMIFLLPKEDIRSIEKPSETQGSTVEVSLGPVIKVMEGGIFPYMFHSANGTLVVQGTFERSPSSEKPEPSEFGGIPHTVRSMDRGQTWQVWSPQPGQGEGPTINNSPVQFKDGSLLIFHWIAEFKRDGLAIGKRWKSTDDWRTVTGPEDTRVEVPDGVGGGIGDNGLPYSTMWFHRSILELSNGDLIAGCYGWFKEDKTPSEYEPRMNRFRCFLVRSKDRGLNWKYVSTIAVDPMVGQEGFNESALMRLSQGKHKGRLICIMRVGRKNPLHQAHSDDDGNSWSAPRTLNLVGVDPDLIEMKNGVLVSSFGHKPDCNNDGNFLAFSLDQGDNWSQIVRLSSESEITGAYTTVREISPGTLFVVYEVRDGTYDSPSRRILGRKVWVTLRK